MAFSSQKNEDVDVSVKYMHSARTHNIKKKNIKGIWTLQFRCLDAGVLFVCQVKAIFY